MKIGSDGKFFDRLIPSLLSAGIAVGIGAVASWSDSRVQDQKFAEQIASLKEAAAAQAKKTEDESARLTRKMESIEAEAREQRQAAAADRQKTAELAGDVRNILRSTARVEQLLDRLFITQPAPPSRP